jgi:hypothetical protein
MLAMAVLAREQVAPGEIVESMAAARALYDVATLASRELVRVRDCYTLWQGVHAEFKALCQAWEGTPQDGELVSQHRAQLRWLLELSADRVGLYSITPAERQIFVNGQKGGVPPKLEKPVKEFSSREISRIDAALDRRLHR